MSKSDYDEIDFVGWKLLKWYLITFVIILLISALCWIGNALFFPVDQSKKIIEATFNAENVIYNYEWFHKQYNDYLSAISQENIKQQEVNQFMATAGSRENWTVSTQNEERQLRIELNGLRSNRINIASEYNSHLNMTNRNIFRQHSLPEHLSSD
jgi:hypothetical protein